MVERHPKIIGNSPALRDVLARAERAGRTMTSVLVRGETGTGKELLARQIHIASGRTGRFVAINCAAIPTNLLESDLFGHERGAFSGAVESREGAFEQANGGTLFLDEIGDMAPEHQAKVLRALQEGEVRRIGGNKTVKVDVRIVAATHRDLRAPGSTFREDLWYRVARYEVHLPPLRERGRDVVEIARAVLKREHPKKYLSLDAQATLLSYQWPGNVRQLENVVCGAAIDARGQRIASKDLLPKMARGPAQPSVGEEDNRLAGALAFLKAHGRITLADVRALCHVERSHALRLLKDWVLQGELVSQGHGRGTHYVARTAGDAQLPARLQLALRLAAERGRITRTEYEHEAKVSARTAKRDLGELVGRGLLHPAGAGKLTAYLSHCDARSLGQPVVA